LAVVRDIAACVVAMASYILAALCIGWAISTLLKPMGYVWPRFAIVAALSTSLGMLVSWCLTNALFPRRSGKVIFAAFAGVVLLVSLAGRGNAVNWLHTAQALLLVGLAYVLFWPHRRHVR
jgi:hypothetical protein